LSIRLNFYIFTQNTIFMAFVLLYKGNYYG
jgi:hypothetical protein